MEGLWKKGVEQEQCWLVRSELGEPGRPEVHPLLFCQELTRLLMVPSPHSGQAVVLTSEGALLCDTQE